MQTQEKTLILCFLSHTRETSYAAYKEIVKSNEAGEIKFISAHPDDTNPPRNFHALVSTCPLSQSADASFAKIPLKVLYDFEDTLDTIKYSNAYKLG